MNYGPASKYYDLFGSENDIDFYKELALKYGRKALELGVGTGRVAIELAKAGVAVWGIDNSRYMLNAARQKLEKESISVRRRMMLKLADMRDFKLKETFPFIYLASSTFEHCIKEEDQRKCLSSVYNALERNGVLAFDISQLEQGKPESSWWIDRAEFNGEEVVRTIFSRRDPKTNVVSLNLLFDIFKNGRLKERIYDNGEARISSKADIEKLLENIGFEVRGVYGDFSKSPYNNSSKIAIFMAEM